VAANAPQGLDDRLDQRIPEPELMDEPAQAHAYSTADFSQVNQGFADRFRMTFPDVAEGRVVDLGCGPADIPVRLARAVPRIEILAIDGARAMLHLARAAVNTSGLDRRVRVIAARVPALPFGDHRLDACISNSLLHHLADPLTFWREIRRIARPGAPLLVMDLFRPPTRAAARAIVDAAAAEESPILRRDFYHSLLAAFTVDEVRAQLGQGGLGYCSCEIVSERHWLVAGRLRGG
jgi:ubiquinone/menaquinone biosynthesis C-methylase UbiE